ncbi:putative dual-specificity RNA methyltransferase RlmN [Phycisphaerae bacterium RAS1]|nr:putative dual-specificity RNA methyltransferase RlmN [Phycisphaerae bacterium RAS1]
MEIPRTDSHELAIQPEAFASPLDTALPLAATADPRLHLLGASADDLRVWLVANGHQKYRSAQLVDWIYAKNAETFEQMTNLSKPLRTWLTENAHLYRSTVARSQAAADGTQKFLLTFADGRSVESVWIPENQRHTACISSQVGCPVGCKFCASGLTGVERNLTAGEIVEQVLRVRRTVADTTAPAHDGQPARLSNVVFMGMGEPLANYHEVMAAVRIINASWGCGIGARKITISTVGLPRQIRMLAEEELQLNLALSLHAPDDALRQELIPWGRVPIAELIDACSYYFQKTGREITLEYVLLAEVNDRPTQADKLAVVCKRLRCNVNLLRYNPVEGTPYARPTAEAAFRFQERLRERGVNAHIRTSRGQDIDAACGQLRRRALAEDGIEPQRHRDTESSD